MPPVSQNQNAAMHAAAEGKSTLGIPKKVGQDFVTADHGRSIADLPSHVGNPPHRKIRRGKRGKGGPKGSPKDHHKNVGMALEKGDHAAARSHAFALVRSLNVPTDAAPVQVAQPAEPKPAKPSGENSAKLLAALRFGKGK